MNKLEQDFESVKAEVNAKLEEAAKLIREANDLATNSTGLCIYELADEYIEETDECLIDKHGLFGALDYCGWSTSSLSC